MILYINSFPSNVTYKNEKLRSQRLKLKLLNIPGSFCYSRCHQADELQSIYHPSALPAASQTSCKLLMSYQQLPPPVFCIPKARMQLLLPSAPCPASQRMHGWRFPHLNNPWHLCPVLCTTPTLILHRAGTIPPQIHPKSTPNPELP